MKLTFAYCILTEMVLTSRGKKEMKKDEFKYFSEKFADVIRPLQAPGFVELTLKHKE